MCFIMTQHYKYVMQCVFCVKGRELDVYNEVVRYDLEIIHMPWDVSDNVVVLCSIMGQSHTVSAFTIAASKSWETQWLYENMGTGFFF